MRAVIRREEGVALPIAMIVLTAILVLSATVALSSINSSTGSTRDRGAKAAIAAANAGAQAAIYRLSQTGAAATDCFTTIGVAPTGGICPGQTESIGNGASFTYYVSPVLGPTDGCTGLYVQGTSSVPALQRCVTAVGTALGSTQRVQLRIAASAPFRVNGMLTYGDATASGTFNFSGDLESNGKIKLPGSGTLTGTTLHYTAGNPAPIAPTCTVGCSTVQEPADYPTPSIDTTSYALSAAPGGNNNAAISWLPPAAYNPATREVDYSGTVGSAASPVIIPSGTYNFCEFKFTNKTYIALAPGARVRIYIDSPYRAGSGCASGTGDISFSNSMQIDNASGDPTALQIFAYGDPADPKQTVIKVTNQVNGGPGTPLYAQIFAPYSEFSTTNVLTMVGGLVAAKYTSSNNVTFTGSGGGSSVSPPYYPAAWHECPKTASGADPGSGCY